ncbi:hypothetical protein AHAS_Ahas11G0087800 [Arachis hypogaea]
MRVLWNGEELDEFFPSRGIRQGDPLSPYIFVLCIERLSQLVNAAVDHGFWKPIKLNRDGSKLSHLCFADDLILFAEANLQQVDIIKKFLKAFCDSSGQKISNEKARVYFSKNVGNQVRIEISEALEFARTDNLGKYLGVPLLHSKVSKHTFNDIINKLNSRLNSWKASSLSFAGRTTLVKSVLSSIPLYTMQTALLPVSTCNVIDRKCRSFLWGDTDQSKKIHLMNWDKVCQPKKAGGLGIRHASKMNHTFMMKAGWELVEKRDSLWITMLRSKYKAGKDIIPNVERKPNSSNMWKGICKSWPDVKQNHIWRIGDGSVIKFWQHNWVPNLGSLDQHVPQDAVKLNVDSSYMAITNNATCGGILRNCLGGFIKGFSCNLGSCSIMHAELWGIVHGLRIATSLNLFCVIVESDSASALKFITQNCPATHSCSSLIEEIKLQANRIPHVYWDNVPREANSVTDQLTKKGQHLPLGLHTFDSAPCEISHILASDIAFIPLFRGI